MIKKCLFCNKEFHIKPSKFKKRVFCSWPCYRKAKGRNRIKKCEHCGKFFDRKCNRIQKFCGIKCYKDFRIKNRMRKCTYCGNVFDPGHSKAQKHCSLGCKSHNNYINSNKLTPFERLLYNFNRCAIKNTDNCWDWKGSLNHAGYGRLTYNNYRIGAHRASWLIHKGKIPKGLFVCHKCDNPKCTNPKHLFLGTALDNTLDMIKKNRQSINKPLTIKQATKVKKLLKLNLTCSEIAKECGVKISFVWNIKYKKTFTYITI